MFFLLTTLEKSFRNERSRKIKYKSEGSSISVEYSAFKHTSSLSVSVKKIKYLHKAVSEWHSYKNIKKNALNPEVIQRNTKKNTNIYKGGVYMRQIVPFL